MKAGREHIVPVTPRCMEILTEAKAMFAESEMVFPDEQTGRMMSENRFLNVRDALGYSKEQCTPHGFRSSFRDWAAEETTFPSEVVEMAWRTRSRTRSRRHIGAGICWPSGGS